MTESAIIFNNVRKSFVRADGSRQHVLDSVSFSIPAGKTTVIAGGSGQGKSVTLKLVLGLLKADAGSIVIDGKDVTQARGRRLEALRSNFGVLFQGSALFDSLTVFDNIALPLRERTAKTEKEIREQVYASLAQFELEGHETKYPAQISGGMRKRVGLARAMQLQPSILLFDEPTTGLDPLMTQEIYQLFARTQQQFGFTSVIVSHDIPKVFNLADQVIILHNGKTDVFDSPEQLQWSEQAHIQEFVATTMGEVYQSGLVEK
ncbi:MAG: ABC transporter ATP-binding protein [Deltaproteobacteria bacterium]|nr:MAG: ABC transporter ATP-binding protein [Deltaproteobacteria bacterium]PIE73181.1 MAG: ABC transporter ATP-binding protein [Deltaproteobacteria bacterium]